MKLRTVVLLTVTLVTACWLQAQVTSRLSGSVVDPSTAAVPSATVDLLLPGGAKAILSTVTTTEGLFTFTGVPAGTYDVAIAAKGFRKFTEHGVVIAAGVEVALPAFRLDVGAATEVVEVTETKQEVQTTNDEISTNVTRTQVKELPILNRSPQSFVDTQPGVNMSRGGDSVINGERTSFTNVTLDGINIQDNYIRTNAVDYSPNLLLLDQVAEFTISTSNTNPAFGNGSSQVSFVTPSGGDAFHGTVFWSNRNNALAANAWFNNQSGVRKPFLNQNQAGGTIGGPIRKDKLFFYVNYEAFRQKQQVGETRTILTSTAAQGIFTYLVGGVPQQVNLLQISGQKADPTVAALYAQIPKPSQINNYSVGDSTAALLRNTAGYLYNQRDNRTRNNVTGRIDYVMSAKSTISGTYAWNSDLLDRPDVNTTGFQLVPPCNNNDKTNFLSTGWRYNPKPTLTNEVRFGFNFAPALFITDQDFGSAIIGSTIFSTPVGTFRGQGRYTDTYNFADNASWQHGGHNILFGVQWQYDHTNPYNDAGITPTYAVGISTVNTSGLTTAQLPGASTTDIANANSLLATMAGFLTSYTQTFNVKSTTSGYVSNYTQNRNWLFNDYSAYIQDNWRAARRLTVNLGLRYEYYSPVKEQNGLVLLPQLVNNNPLTTLLSNGTLNFDKGGLYNPDKKNFAPNVGLAYDLSGDGRTALRAGYSVNFVNDEYLVALTGNANTNAGLAQTVTNPTPLASLIAAGLPAINTPAFVVPRQFSDNYALSPTTSFGMSDPNLRAPYVQQWNIGIQHEVKSFILEARYVGNHGTKLLRALDFNQININADGFLADFLRAQQNGNLALAATGNFVPTYNSAIPGEQPLTVFPTMPNGGSLTNSTNINYIRQGAVADMAYAYQSGKNNGPVGFFPNPYAASLRLMTNYSNSTYNGLQLEMRTRDYHGLTFQGSYVFAKALSDSVSGSDNNNQGRYEPLMDNNNPGLAKARALFDINQDYKANFVYALPMGKDHAFHVAALDRFVLSGWYISGIYTRQSGYPYSLCSGIGTFNRNNNLATNECNTVNTADSLGQLQQIMQFRMTGNGPYQVAQSALNANGQAAVAGAAPFSGQIVTMPGAGTIGQLQARAFTGPWDSTFDFGVFKVTKITERQMVTLRFDSTNFFNHPAFSIGDQTVTSATFGKITSTFSSSRRMQFTLTYQF